MKAHLVGIHSEPLWLEAGHIRHKALEGRHASGAAYKQHLRYGRAPLGPHLHSRAPCPAALFPAPLLRSRVVLQHRAEIHARLRSG